MTGALMLAQAVPRVELQYHCNDPFLGILKILLQRWNKNEFTGYVTLQRKGEIRRLPGQL